MRNQLLEYQESAVKTLSRRIMTRGGAMLGDVVGLGKTITAGKEPQRWDPARIGSAVASGIFGTRPGGLQMGGG